MTRSECMEVKPGYKQTEVGVIPEDWNVENDAFHALLTQHMPKWRLIRDELNHAPLAHETWKQE